MEKTKKIRGWGYSIIRPLLCLFCILVLLPKRVNRNKMPKKGGFILSGNHLSYYDPIIIGYSNIRPIHFIAKKELFDNLFLGAILRFMGIIRVDRKNKNPEARKEAIDALKQDKVVCIFPEGTCNRTEDDLLPFKYGAVSFAYKSGKPIVPFAIIKKPRLFHYRNVVIFGDPFYVKNDNYEEANKILRDKVLNLLLEGRKKYGKKKRRA